MTKFLVIFMSHINYSRHENNTTVYTASFYGKS